MVKRIQHILLGATALTCLATFALPASAQVLSAGGSHTLAINADGMIEAWGSGPGINDVPAGSNFIAVSAGGDHSLALTDGGVVHAWGSDTSGQTSVPTLSSVKAIAAGGQISVALQTNGEVGAWGNSSIPSTDVFSGVTAIAIAASDRSAIALGADGFVTVQPIGTDLSSPGSLLVQNGNIRAIAAAGGHALGLNADGTVEAWGSNTFGQTDVTPGLDDAVAISAGNTGLGAFSVALRSTGQVAVWGSVTSVADNTDFVYVDAGAEHAYAVKSDGSIQFEGNPGGDRNAVPSPLTLPTTVTWASASGVHPLDGDYLNSHRWEQGIPSTKDSTAVFNQAGTYEVKFGNTARADNLVISAGDVTFNQVAGSYQVENNITISGSGTEFRFNGEVSAANIAGNNLISNEGLIAIASGGHLTTPGSITNASSGSITVAGGGQISADTINNAGDISIANDATVSADTITGSGNIVNDGTLGGDVMLTGRLSGNGTIDGALTISNSAVLAPGSSVGEVKTTVGTDVVFGEKGIFEFEVNDAGGVPGGPQGWDLLNINGKLDVTATNADPLNRFFVNISSLTPANDPGSADNFNKLDDYNWEFVRTAQGIFGFNSNLFAINSTGFQNDTFGAFSISQDGNSLFVTYTAVPEPSSFVVLGVAGLGFAGYRRRRQCKDKLAEGDGKPENASAPSANVV